MSTIKRRVSLEHGLKTKLKTVSDKTGKSITELLVAKMDINLRIVRPKGRYRKTQSLTINFPEDVYNRALAREEKLNSFVDSCIKEIIEEHNEVD